MEVRGVVGACMGIYLSWVGEAVERALGSGSDVG